MESNNKLVSLKEKWYKLITDSDYTMFGDKEKVFDTILLNKLEGFYDDLGWKLVTNPYINQFFM